MDLEALRRQILARNFAVRPHAMQHAVKEGFTDSHIVHVALNGLPVEIYPERHRCLLYNDVMLEGLKFPLHVLCEHRNPRATVDIVTAYIPSETEWESPNRRRKRRR